MRINPKLCSKCPHYEKRLYSGNEFDMICHKAQIVIAHGQRDIAIISGVVPYFCDMLLEYKILYDEEREANESATAKRLLPP